MPSQVSVEIASEPTASSAAATSASTSQGSTRHEPAARGARRGAASAGRAAAIRRGFEVAILLMSARAAPLGSILARDSGRPRAEPPSRPYDAATDGLPIHALSPAPPRRGDPQDRARDAARSRRPHPAPLRGRGRGHRSPDPRVPEPAPPVARPARRGGARASPRAGCAGVLLFGLPGSKDAEGSSAWDDDGVVQRGVRAIRARRARAAGDHRRLPLPVHGSRLVRRARRERRGRQRRDASSCSRASPCRTPRRAPTSSRRPT